ncbi:hypothetical protein BamIOP4010DRAFT_5579 [Burkholderia ambifaria IOP40-10]|uniref:Uncharacterized protein n=1 Tax=Burkholderia ambifaria IOP40-10 TaxID=396596 RepID=B1FNG8_9BURK|nr:hypothetical protein BamIOP4010DRAFT_5579 [Burkholderia ambifaria IOP40-10]
MLAGPLTAATATSCGHASIARSTVARSVKMAAISPSRGNACISRPRSAISRRPSSGEKTPAAQAAAYSPTLCPITASGTTPNDASNVVSANCSENRAGWL